jgi:hypothetical protein
MAKKAKKIKKEKKPKISKVEVKISQIVEDFNKKFKQARKSKGLEKLKQESVDEYEGHKEEIQLQLLEVLHKYKVNPADMYLILEEINEKLQEKEPALRMAVLVAKMGKMMMGGQEAEKGKSGKAQADEGKTSYVG